MNELVDLVAAAEAELPRDKELVFRPGGIRQMGLPTSTYEALASACRAVPVFADLGGHYQYGFGKSHISQLDEYLLAASLVRRTRELGSATAAVAELLELIERNEAIAELVTVISGVSVQEPLQLAPNVQLVPYSWGQIPAWIRRIEAAGFGLMDRQFADVPFAAAIVRQFPFSPVFGPEALARGDTPVDHMTEVTKLTMSLSLASTTAIGIVRMFWGDADPRLPIITDPPIFTSPHWTEGPVEPPVALDEVAALDIVGSYLQFRGPKDSLDLVIERLNRSRRKWQDEDRAIELGIALEALLMHGDATGNQEISFKLRLRAAWLVGRTIEERREIFQQVGKLYTLRSQAAHQGKLSSKNDLSEQMAMLIEGGELVCRLVVAVLRHRDWPDWQTLVLGGIESESDHLNSGAEHNIAGYAERKDWPPTEAIGNRAIDELGSAEA